MAITIDAEWAGDNANSYLTIAEADAIVLNEIVEAGYREAWGCAVPDDKARMLIRSAIDIDSLQYLGSRFFMSQALELPRRYDTAAGTKDPIRLLNDYDAVQSRQARDVKRAAAYQAVWTAYAPASGFDYDIHRFNQNIGISEYSEATGPLREAVKYKGSGSAVQLSPNVKTILTPYLRGRLVVRG